MEFSCSVLLLGSWSGTKKQSNLSTTRARLTVHSTTSTMGTSLFTYWISSLNDKESRKIQAVRDILLSLDLSWLRWSFSELYLSFSKLPSNGFLFAFFNLSMMFSWLFCSFCFLANVLLLSLTDFIYLNEIWSRLSAFLHFFHFVWTKYLQRDPQTFTEVSSHFQNQ